jgi:hypothetical protein
VLAGLLAIEAERREAALQDLADGLLREQVCFRDRGRVGFDAHADAAPVVRADDFRGSFGGIERRLQFI